MQEEGLRVYVGRQSVAMPTGKSDEGKKGKMVSLTFPVKGFYSGLPLT